MTLSLFRCVVFVLVTACSAEVLSLAETCGDAGCEDLSQMNEADTSVELLQRQASELVAEDEDEVDGDDAVDSADEGEIEEDETAEGDCHRKCSKRYSKFTKKGIWAKKFKKVCRKDMCKGCTFCQEEPPTPTPTAGPCEDRCQDLYDKFEDKGKAKEGQEKVCEKYACSGCEMCTDPEWEPPTAEPTEAPTAEPTPEPTEEPTAEPTPEPTEEPTAEPTPAPTDKKVVIRTADWWSAFDRKGWVTTEGGFTGIFRNDCHELYCIEEVRYANFPLGECYNANWWNSFDRKGWSTCNAGYFITGLYRNSCHSLYCLEEAKCCQRNGQSRYTGDCYNLNVWNSFDRKGWAECRAGFSMTGIFRNDCNKLYCIEEFKCCPYEEPTEEPTAEPTPEPTASPTQKPVAIRTADWWSAFDRKGWVTTDGGFTGIFRNDCHELYCIEEVRYANFPLGQCYNANWWNSFDRKGWSTCNDGYFITGLYRNSCHSLYCLEEAKCCQRSGQSRYTGGCYNLNVWNSFDRKGWAECRAGFSMTGIFRNDCNKLYCIEEFKCCPYQ